MLAFSALVAGSFSLGAQAAKDIEPAALNAVRFVIAALVIGAALLATRGLPRGTVRAPWRYIVLGALLIGQLAMGGRQHLATGCHHHASGWPPT